MNTKLSLYVDPDHIDSPRAILDLIRKQLNLPVDADPEYVIRRKSIDSRKKRPRFLLDIEVFSPETLQKKALLQENFKPLSPDHRVVIVGAGPAGYFAALELLEQGIRPILLERGKDVTSRRKDIQQIHSKGIVNPHSNYCFGEGGAGAYSDGKLYTRSHKRGDIGKILSLLVAHGAPEDILMDAHPHIGSNRLPRVVKSIRETILSHGGKIHFESWVTDLIIDGGRAAGVWVEGKGKIPADAVILATGHSARDIFELLNRKNIRIEPKPFAMGVRVEHPQSLIDRIQYHHSPRHSKLPAASYRLVEQIEGRGVFSFCMCPGGFIVPASTAPGELVINGMSLAARDAPFSNSGVVVEIRLEDIDAASEKGPLAAMEFQKKLEQRAFQAGGSGLLAPAQRMTDFTAGRLSASLPNSSYKPGIVSAPVHELLPEGICRRLQAAFQAFDRKMKGYFTGEALVLAIESRTSSPVRIPRDENTLMHPQIEQLYPCSEGAGYAGGIVSAALDGQRVARKISEKIRGL
ncbi:MAG: FAD-dependent oxidoreductase [Deltaproteobacteria bacterium]|nr:FAD-dependent oxidoreductase [Deltaproteobacteria bacterium]